MRLVGFMATGGYDYVFTNPDIPDEFVCTICIMVAREAQQSSCCGKIYCRSCLKQLEETSHRFSCPNCRADLCNSFFPR